MNATRRRATNGRATTRRTGTTARRSSTTYRRRRRPTTAATVGSALGVLIWSWVTGAGWPTRIGLVVAVVVLGLAYFFWTRRAEIAAAAREQSETASTPTTPVTHPPEESS